MTVSNGANGGERDGQGRFLRYAGPGNPAVRRLAAAQAAVRAAATAKDVRRVLDKLRDLALAGDVQAGVAWLARTLGRPPQGPAVSAPLELPAISTAAGCLAATETIIAATVGGGLDHQVAALLLGAVQVRLRAIEATEFEQRIRRLEDVAAKDGGRRW